MDIEKKSKTHTRLEKRFLIGRSRRKHANFQESHCFQATYSIKKKQKNKQLIQLILCQLDVGGWRKEKGKKLTDVIKENLLVMKTVSGCNTE